MDKEQEFFKITSSVVLGFLASVYQKYAVMLLLMSVAIVFDIITGIIKAKCSDEVISSKKGTKGFFKKLAFFIAYFFGVFLDLFVPYALEISNTNIEIECCFGLIIGIYITLNESISICENIYSVNNQIIPRWITDYLLNFRKKVDKTDDGGEQNEKIAK